MRFFLKSVVPGARRVRGLRVRNTRRLSFEQLNARHMMAADTAESLEPEADVAPAAEETTRLAPESTDDSPLWGPSAAESSGGTAMTTSSDGYGGYGGYGFIPPEISGFTCYESSYGAWTFTGTVTDDESVQGLFVHFGGLLEGESAMVQADGSFEFTIYLGPEAMGEVSAVVTDWDGIQSEEAETVVV